MKDENKLGLYIGKCRLQRYMDLDLEKIASLCSFAQNEYLIHAGIPSNYLYFVVEGEVVLFSYTAEEKNTYISWLWKGEMIGEAGSLWQTPPVVNVKAMTPCICVCIDLSKYRQALLQDLTFLRTVCRILNARLANGNLVANSLMEPLETRLARFLLNQEIDNIFSMQLTVCAAMLNTSYRHLLRTIRKFVERGYVRKIKGSYLITDRKGLQQTARGRENDETEETAGTKKHHGSDR
ncbi:MAG: cyclic nucleotide-binding domain-containing protein [Eubacteriales bacterium]|nr:cyclic nucleotide-binding domain-containing protein [Eubacteriales bacterium]